MTDGMIVPLGLTPRRGGSHPQPRLPIRVTGVVAEPSGGSSIRVSWDRAGNSARTTFVVESSSDNVDFAPVKTLTRTSLVVPDCAPGVSVYFRVLATTSTSESEPSQAVGAYLPSASSAFSKADLKLAA